MSDNPFDREAIDEAGERQLFYISGTVDHFALRVLRQNERIKLLASALDRLSTAFCTAGIATPLAGRLFGTVSNSLPSWFYGATFGVFAGLAVMLHLLARRVLGGLR